ncbi:MAG: hypothetical protein ACKVW3_12915 [Phycisphaerales bacterium]
MADITPVTPSIAGVNPGPVAAAGGGDAVPNPRGNVLIRVDNAAGLSMNVTINPGPTTTRPGDGTFPNMTLLAQVVAVPAGQTRVIGPIPPAFNDANGKVQVSYSTATSVTISALQLP